MFHLSGPDVIIPPVWGADFDIGVIWQVSGALVMSRTEHSVAWAWRRRFLLQDDCLVRLPQSRQQLPDLEVQRSSGASRLESLFAVQLPGRRSSSSPALLKEAASDWHTHSSGRGPVLRLLPLSQWGDSLCFAISVISETWFKYV